MPEKTPFTPHPLTLPDGVSLHAGSWPAAGPAKAALVISHGYGEHIRRYDHVAAALNQRGYAVYAADHRGHGGSSTPPTAYYDRLAHVVDDLSRVIAWAAAEQPNKPLFLLGHSMGGLISLTYALRETAANRLTLKGLIQSATFMSPSADVPAVQAAIVRTLSRIAPRLGVVERVPSSALSRAGEIGMAYDNDPLVYHGKVAARVAVEAVNGSDAVLSGLSRLTVPILILHGTADSIASPVNSQRIYDGVGSQDKTFKRYEGAYHEILNETNRQEVIDDVLMWLEKHN